MRAHRHTQALQVPAPMARNSAPHEQNAVTSPSEGHHDGGQIHRCFLTSHHLHTYTQGQAHDCTRKHQPPAHSPGMPML